MRLKGNTREGIMIVVKLRADTFWAIQTMSQTARGERDATITSPPSPNRFRGGDGDAAPRVPSRASTTACSAPQAGRNAVATQLGRPPPARPMGRCGPGGEPR